MKIFSIDSTSATARISLTEKNKVIKEISHPIGDNDWDDMVAGKIDFLIRAFLNILKSFYDDVPYGWEKIELICYSGESGFKNSMYIGKTIAETLGITHNIEVISVDHITAHYFSFFVNRQEDGSFPKLVYSASGSHNSLAYFRAENDLMILNDNTYFDSDNKKYIGLGSIYNSLLRSLDILKEYQSPQEIPKVLTNIHRETEIDIINEFKKLYGSENTFDFEMYHWYIDCKKIMKRRKNIFSAEILFCSFERALFEILAEKFDRISDIMFIGEIVIVGGISQNDHFIKFLEKKFQGKYTISRPLLDYRFDNASMLGVLAYNIKKHNTQFPFSQIIT